MTILRREIAMPKDTLTILDNRTGKQYEIPIEHGAIRTADLRQIKVSDDDFGLMGYDPAFTNTASCKSRITFIDGDRGILRYRGYPIEELAEHSNYLETAYLIVKGELPDVKRFEMWRHNIVVHTFVHENIKMFMDGFRYDSHPMGMLVSTVGALSTFYPEAKHVEEIENRRLQTRRLIGKLPTLAAFAYRRTKGLPYVYPDNELSYTGNFLQMLFKMGERVYQPNPILERALDVLFILHAMLREIGTIDKVPAFIKDVKAGKGRLMGFGHRVYRNYDPRGKIIKQLAYEVFEITGKNPLIDIALELERIALQDDYFVSRKLYPNVDFYSGIIYEAMSFPLTMFPVLFAIPRVSGWLAQWAEMVRDPEQKISRPRQVYLGEGTRRWHPIEQRPEPTEREEAVSTLI
jgi:citrate synthase